MTMLTFQIRCDEYCDRKIKVFFKTLDFFSYLFFCLKGGFFWIAMLLFFSLVPVLIVKKSRADPEIMKKLGVSEVQQKSVRAFIC